MASQIERVLRQALTTFSGTPQDFRGNFTKLMENVGELDARSVGLDTALLRYESPPREMPGERPQERRQAPITYVAIFQNELVTVSLFVLNDGVRIPLHDHPCMHGLLKVVHGKVGIQSYTPAQRDWGQLNKINVKKLAPIIVTETDRPSVLYPFEGNIHQIDAIEGPAAFVDIVAPPYTNGGKRHCRFYKELNTSKGMKLRTVAAPDDYRSIAVKYTGPTFSV